MKITLKKIEEGVCPYCGSTNLNHGFMELHDDMLMYPVTCSDCGRDFEEWYSIKFSGHNVGDCCEYALNDGVENAEIEVEDGEE